MLDKQGYMQARVFTRQHALTHARTRAHTHTHTHTHKYVICIAFHGNDSRTRFSITLYVQYLVFFVHTNTYMLANVDCSVQKVE